ncbi:taurine ABC transporter substrate-binding protein [Carnimonas bestiolae]|uniref:taurine ABC transporter substrate-binding protein n=1 Tax=Carnimonas bestiolae TaxID=3402172 RepID=UPI003F4AE742
MPFFSALQRSVSRSSMLLLLAAATALPLGAQAADDASSGSFTFAWQTGADPTKVPQAQGDYEKATGWHIDWKRFDSGPAVIAALASGDVQVADLGSGPLAAATSRDLPITTFLIVNQLGSAESLVVSNKSGITNPQQLKGKTIATPFVSTSHFSLLGALKHWGIDRRDVDIVNMDPPSIIAAYKRGDIDGAYVWAPALNQLTPSGHVLTDSDQVAKWGSPTFEVWVARKDFAEQHPDVLRQLAAVSLDYFDRYNRNPKAWNASSEQAQQIAKLIGVSADDVPGLLAGAHYPDKNAQLSQRYLGGGTALQLKKTAAFIYGLGTIPAVLDDYAPYVDNAFIKAIPSTSKTQQAAAHSANGSPSDNRSSHE